jgi:flavodoxin I
MSKIGLFFATQTGKTEGVADLIKEQLGEKNVDIYDMANATASDFDSYSYLIIGSPTWDIGELPADWEAFMPELETMNFSDKTIAYFGTGDQVGYADNYMDAVGILEAKISEQGGKTIGQWPTDGYDFDASKAVRGNKFVGLALDEDNQGDLTEARVREWLKIVKPAFGLS